MTTPQMDTMNTQRVYTPDTEAYLAGPMRFADDYNFPAFYQAEVAIEEQTGLKVFNPARNDCVHYGLPFGSSDEAHESGQWLRDHVGEEFDLRRAIYEDLKFISLTAKAVYVLPGWESSTGVRAEKATAECLDIPVFEVIFHDDGIEFVPAPKTAQTPSRATRVAAERDRFMLSEMVGKPHMVPAVDLHVESQVAPVAQFSKSGEVISVSKTGGQKGTKLARFDLIPSEPMTLVAEHFGVGARKYADHNWRKGYEWGKSYSAMRRHLEAFWSGKDFDTHEDDCPADCVEHTGSRHIVAAAWHALVLTEFSLYYPQFDDRFTAATREALTREV